jgi:eukaryotic-like serine/threonine-protein kinase
VASKAILAGMMYPAYLRGEAYLMLSQGKDAAAEFQKFFDHPGIVKYSPLASLAHLGLARALALDGKLGESQLAYERFFELWSGADPQIPILQQAKAEYAT